MGSGQTGVIATSGHVDASGHRSSYSCGLPYSLESAEEVHLQDDRSAVAGFVCMR